MAQEKNEFSEHMSFEFLELLRKKNPAWRLLASPQAPLVAAFLYKVFIAENRRLIAEQELISRLESFIDLLSHHDDVRHQSMLRNISIEEYERERKAREVARYVHQVV